MELHQFALNELNAYLWSQKQEKILSNEAIRLSLFRQQSLGC